MIGFAYLGALLVSLGGLAVLDHRFQLAFFADWRRTASCLGIGLVFFLVWDIAGIALGIFARGDNPYMTGLQLAPELPVEEAFFLVLLCYNTLLVWLAFDRRASRQGATARVDGAGAAGGGSR